MRGCLRAALWLIASGVAAPAAGQSAHPDPSHNLVAVGIVRRGEAILLATPGLEDGGRHWRFRSLDTGELGAPMHQLVLTRSATKLFPGYVALQYKF